MKKSQKNTNILLVDKPKGMTSFDVIRELRRKLGVRKMGHAGTLDPLATGLLIIGIGDGTKKLSKFLKLPKVYEATMQIGISTTTDDLEGEVVERKRVTDISNAAVHRVFEDMKGPLVLSVPKYSAVKVKGKPLYKYAREGREVTIPKKKMEIRGFDLHRVYEKNGSVFVDVVLEVSSGTYIRSIAKEVGHRLGHPATLADLRRTKIGEFSIKDAKKLDEIE